jgi:hypothetical protein
LTAFSGTGALHTQVPLSHFFNNIAIELDVGVLTYLHYSESCRYGHFYDGDWEAFIGCMRASMKKLSARESVTLSFDVYLWSSGRLARISDWVQTELEGMFGELHGRGFEKVDVNWFAEQRPNRRI